MKKVYTALFGLVSSFILTGCGGSDNNASVTVVQSATIIDAEIIKTTALHIDNEALNVNEHTIISTQKLYKDLNKSLQNMDNMLSSMNTMIERNLETFQLSMNLAAKLAQPFQIAENYRTVFSTQEYTQTAPPFAISGVLGEKYFLKASTTQYFLEGNTIKKYFYDASSLSYGWSALLNEIDKNKNLYLQIVQISDTGTITKVTTPFVIPSSKLLLL